MKKLYFIFVILFSLSIQAQIIVLDPGHGYGATTSDNPDGRTATEIETALEVGLRTRNLIQGSCNWTVYMTRTTNLNSWISVTQRAQMSNNWNADRLLSIHCNAGGGSGTETFYCTQDDTNTTPDINFANKIQTDMASNGQWSNRRCVEDNSYLSYHLGVLRYSSATGCLNEIGFVDSSDATKLTSSTWRDTFAASYFSSLQTNLNLTCTSSSAPGSFSLTATPQCSGTSTRISLSWTAAANATSYDIYRNGSLYTNVTGTSFINTSVTAGTSYTYYVKAKNSSGSTNNSNGTLSATAPNCSTPGSFTLTATSVCDGTASAINLSWTSSTNATSYDIYRNGSLYASDITGTSFLNTYLISAGSTYTYYVKAKNSLGTINNSNGTQSVTAVACSPGAFTLTATATCSGGSSAINLSWTSSANATSYDIYRNGNLYASDVTGTSFLNTYLINAGSTYTYYVKAKNSIGSTNNSNGTRSVTATNCSSAKIADSKNATGVEVTSITLYPNPTNGIVNIQMDVENSLPMEYSIMDTNGRIVKQGKLNEERMIDISNLQSANYWIRISFENKEFIKQIIKQ
ncbi:N-acetylmuramoyl-L-alanine amidase [Flavobacterium sp. U410]